jgi:hypothetical protein
LSFEQRIFLLKHDKDSFVKWDNAQKLWLSLIMDADTIDEVAFFDAIEFMIKNTKDNSLVCVLVLFAQQLLL